MKIVEFFSRKKPISADKMFSINLITCVVGIILCLSSLTAATWAWFSEGITSGSNVIETASYQLSVSVGDVALAELDGDYSFTANADGAYTFKLTATGTATSGYSVVVKTSDGNVSSAKYTQQVKPNTAGISFTLFLKAGDEVEFEPRWGSYSGQKNEERDLQDGETYGEDLTAITE